jgi:hypothetical protein
MLKEPISTKKSNFLKILHPLARPLWDLGKLWRTHSGRNDLKNAKLIVHHHGITIPPKFHQFLTEK